LSLIGIALVVFLVAPAVGVFVAVRAGLDAWRTFKGFTSAAASATGEVTQKLELLAAFEPPDLALAGAAGARLRRDQAELSILLGALGRVREQFSSFATVYPRK